MSLGKYNVSFHVYENEPYIKVSDVKNILTMINLVDESKNIEFLLEALEKINER